MNSELEKKDQQSGNGAEARETQAGAAPEEETLASSNAVSDGEAAPAVEEPEEARDPRELQMENLAKQVEAKDKELADLKNRYHRALADYDNLRRRSAKEVLEAVARGSEKFVTKLLPVLDTFESAMRQIATANVDKKVMDGLEMLSIQFSDVLEKEGLKEIPAKGEKFDPNLHEAFCKRCQDDVEDEIVLNVFEKGYTFKDRVLRPAKVEINQK